MQQVLPHGNATHSNLRLRDSQDAHVLFQAVRQGHLPLIRKRLTGPEQQALHAGQVFVWADREGSLERWTDGHNWSPSRVRGPFLMYDEMPEDTEAFLRRKQQKPGERRVKQPRKKRLPALPGGLSKQTYSATLIQQGMDIQKWHLTAYFQDDRSNDLLTIDDDPLLRTIIVPDNTFKSSMSRKSKSSSSRRRDSVSEHTGHGSSVYYDEDADAESCPRDEGDRDSPVDEYSRSPARRGSGGPLNSSPPLRHHPASFDFTVPSSAMITQPSILPWENRFQPPSLSTPTGSFASSNDDGSSGGGGGSGSSNGSMGTVHGGGMHTHYSHQAGGYFTAPQHPPPGNGYTNMHRGRAMNLEGIHARFDAGLAFSPLSPLETARSQSLNVGSSSGGLDWRGFGGQGDLPILNLAPEGENRRSSLLSLGSSRSNSSQSTSNSSKLSSSSSPASSWSQQSPNLNAANGGWTSFSSKPHEHIQSPLVPGASPASGSIGYRSPLPSHLQHHPEHVPSAVPPNAPPTAPSRRATLPSLYGFGGEQSRQWSPSAPAGQVSSPTTYAQPSSPFGEVPLPSGLPESSSTYRLPSMNSYFPQQQSPQVGTPPDVKFNPAATSELHHPRAVTASGVPGSWEASQSQSVTWNSYDYSGSRVPQYQQSNSYSPSQQYTIPGPNEVFESVVPQAQTPSW